MNKFINLIKSINKAIIVGLIAALLLIFNSFTIVPVGAEASVSSFGKVYADKILTGFNIVPFYWTIDIYNLQYRTYIIDDIGVASRDKFKTSMDVAYTGSFISGFAGKNRSNTGTYSTYINTHVVKRVTSCLTKAGGEIENSQAFFDKETQDSMGNSVLNCVNNYLNKVGGYKLTSVQFSDINLDPVVRQFMVKTKSRQEAETQAKSDLSIADTLAKKIIKTSNANLIAAEVNKKSTILKAEGLKQSMILEASGNEALNKSITSGLVRYVEAKRWNGVRSKIVAGSQTQLLVDARN